MIVPQIEWIKAKILRDQRKDSIKEFYKNLTVKIKPYESKDTKETFQEERQSTTSTANPRTITKGDSNRD